MVKKVKAIQIQKMSKNLKIFSLKIHKDTGILEKKPTTFLNRGIKYKKNYIEGLNSKNKNRNIKGGGNPQ